MKQDIPNIPFKKEQFLGIEVMSFQELLEKLKETENHDPYSVHRIKFYLILVISKNSYTHFVDFKSYDLKEGSVLFLAYNQVHHFTKALLDSDGYCILFSSDYVDKYYFLSDNIKLNRLFNYHIESPVIHQTEIGGESLISLASDAYKEYKLPQDAFKSEILGSLLHILLLKAERTKEDSAVSSVKTGWMEIFSKFKNLLEKDYSKTRNSKDYAAQLLISYKLLNQVVKKLTGKTVKAFIDDFVIIEIKRYLVTTSLSVKEISFQTGFEEPANMVKFFKKSTNQTPLKFRQQL